MRFVGYKATLFAAGREALTARFTPPEGFVWDAQAGMPLNRVSGLRIEPVFEPETCEICGVTEGHKEYCVYARSLVR